VLIALLLIAVALLIAAAFLWHYRWKRPNSSAAQRRDAKRPSESYRSVEVRQGRDACNAVKLLAAKRFLTGEAPPIPVPGCDAASCSCRYVRHEDRRESDRRNPHPQLAAAPPASAGGDRRTKRDRRRAAKPPSRAKLVDKRSMRRRGARGT
jgi:hypothetical protein